MSTIEDEKEFEMYYSNICDYADLKNVEWPEKDCAREYYDQNEPYNQIVDDTLNLYDC